MWGGNQLEAWGVVNHEPVIRSRKGQRDLSSVFWKIKPVASSLWKQRGVIGHSGSKGKRKKKGRRTFKLGSIKLGGKKIGALTDLGEKKNLGMRFHCEGLQTGEGGKKKAAQKGREGGGGWWVVCLVCCVVGVTGGGCGAGGGFLEVGGG